MWELVIDLFWPNREIETIAEKVTSGGLRVEWDRPDACKRALNESRLAR